MILEVKNLNKRYGNKLVVDNMNMNIGKGEVIGLLGPNGAGKTTLINSIIGITGIQSGTIHIFGESMAKNPMKIKSRIGVVPQNIALFNEFSAVENVTYFGRLYGLRGRKLKENVRKALEFVDLWERKMDSPKKYSGGMKRRLNIACAIVHKPDFVIMDEPTVGIDPQSRNRILESIRLLNKQGTTIIYTSHYMEEVEALCSRIVIMDNGKLIAEGTKDRLAEYVQEERIAEIELDQTNFSVTEAIKSVYGVKECTLSGNMVTVVFDKSNHISKIINAISDQGVAITKINMKEANLEDVFLTLTGKTLRD